MRRLNVSIDLIWGFNPINTAIMMLESKLNNLSKNSMKYIPVGFIFGIFLLIPILREISIHFKKNYDSSYLCDVTEMVCGYLVQ